MAWNKGKRSFSSAGGKRPSFERGSKPVESSSPEAAGGAAVALLARRDYGSGELADKLIERGYEREVVEAVVADLLERRLIDDARFTEHYVAYHAQRGHGPSRIRRDLGQLHVANEHIEAAVQAGPDWGELARELRIRKFGQEVPTEWSEKSRQMRFLQYRGFSNDHIRTALGPSVDLPDLD
jgi:regulatory protein